MAGTKAYVPEDAIVKLDATTSTFDLGIYVLALLRKEWKVQNTDGMKPNIEFKEDLVGINFRGLDWVQIHTETENAEAVSAGYNFENLSPSVPVEIHTTKGREHVLRMNGEIRRIIHEHRRDPGGMELLNVTGRRWLQWFPNKQTFDRSNVGYYRRIGEVRMNWRYRQVG